MTRTWACENQSNSTPIRKEVVLNGDYNDSKLLGYLQLQFEIRKIKNN